MLPETVEMLNCLKDWELGEKREQHAAANNKELEETFNNLYLYEDEGGAAIVVLLCELRVDLSLTHLCNICI